MISMFVCDPAVNPPTGKAPLATDNKVLRVPLPLSTQAVLSDASNVRPVGI